jgi:predicted GH43/DUF377 family glycosyl hydrolase
MRRVRARSGYNHWSGDTRGDGFTITNPQFVRPDQDSIMTVPVIRLPLHLTPDPSRVITRLFSPGDTHRIREILARILAFPEAEVVTLLDELKRCFSSKHPDLLEVFTEHYEQVRGNIPVEAEPALSQARRLYIGACFTMEYAIEAVALFNPSIVPALYQEEVSTGSVRFVMSLRATGEGHISSIVFRSGLIDANGDVRLDAPRAYSKTLKATLPDQFSKSTFRRDLATLGVVDGHFNQVMDRLGDHFSRDQLSEAIDLVRQNHDTSGFLEQTADTLISLTRVNYEIRLSQPILFQEFEAVIFPFSDIERHGIEDLRLVRFTDDDGTQVVYGTFTAFNGEHVFPQLMEVRGGHTIDVSLITGKCAKNKGMALFPRRVRGKYAMISRIDNENLYYMESDDILFWDEARPIQSPKFSWQVIQIGNCGSPIETERGWLLLTHGVGPMRQYCIGATLLDHDDPWRVIGQTPEPLLMANDEERSGDVPNVVYSCGAMIHNGMLIVPYAVSDSSTRVARIDLEALFSSLN